MGSDERERWHLQDDAFDKAIIATPTAKNGPVLKLNTVSNPIGVSE